jgi:hypothetical protein
MLPHAQLLGDLCGFSVERKRRASGAQVGHFDIAPAQAAAPARAQRLHARFLGGEARGVALELILLTLGVIDFPAGINPLQKPLAVPRDRILDARYFAQIHPASDDHLLPAYQLRSSP